jgi:hypothetical protein
MDSAQPEDSTPSDETEQRLTVRTSVANRLPKTVVQREPIIGY